MAWGPGGPHVCNFNCRSCDVDGEVLVFGRDKYDPGDSNSINICLSYYMCLGI